MELITDRTQADVLLQNSKGTYSHTDLNRVEKAVQQLAEKAKQLDIHFRGTVKQNWAVPGTFSAQQWPTKGQMERYLGNVSTLCGLLQVTQQIPKSMEKLTWKGANQIELALLEAEQKIRNVTEAFQYSGELFAGEE